MYTGHCPYPRRYLTFRTSDFIGYTDVVDKRAVTVLYISVF